MSVSFSEDVSVIQLETGKKYTYHLKKDGDQSFQDPYTKSWKSKDRIPELKDTDSATQTKSLPTPIQVVSPDLRKASNTTKDGDQTASSKKVSSPKKNVEKPLLDHVNKEKRGGYLKIMKYIVGFFLLICFGVAIAFLF